MSGSPQVFTTVVTEGALLPSDLLVRVVEGDGDLGGLTPAAYHLEGTERLTEAITHSWSRLQGAWSAFREASSKLPDSDAGTTVTRERWLLPLFQELGYGRLPTTKAIEVEGKDYPISHVWDHSPVHLVSFRYELDRRTPGAAGAARTSPHGLVQEFLNRSDEHLWGFVSNGLRLRVLRDHLSLTRQAYVEFDLETMMDEEVYSDFVLLWLVCHQSRVEVKDGSRPEDCWLEQWSEAAREQGTRALEHLRGGVERAIEALGAGFLAHPSNGALREALAAGELTTQDYYRELLRLVYRLLFLFVAEDRALLLEPDAAPEAKERYSRFYSTGRLRRLAGGRRGTKHPDLYRALVVVMEKLGSDAGCAELGLPPLGSYLWSAGALAHLHGADIANHDLLDAVRALALTTEGKVRRTVDYRNLGAEELGSVYESLLELHPTVDTDAAVFSLDVGGGSERKTTGSYYTPTSLIHCLLDSALDPVLEEAAAKADPESAILALKVCDPASGSGHFLIAAAHRIAHKLASVRTGDEEPAPEAWRKALRDVIGHCIYAVDLNPMAVELCKVSLWMEALEPGKPLSFLDHRILCGNSLLGTTPALLANGIPDDAFKPIEGDEKKVVSALRKQNKQERKGQITFFGDMAAETTATYGSLAGKVESLEQIDDTSIEGIHKKEQALRGFAESDEYRRARLVADAWCAAFVWLKDGSEPAPITEQVFRTLQKDPDSVPEAVREEVQRLGGEYRFFHWHLAFPDVFSVPAEGTPENTHTGWNGGFDVVLGNPPWERIKLQEKEFFATRDSEILFAATAGRRRELIAALETENPALFQEFLAARRNADGQIHYIRDSGRYPLTAVGDINTYSIFAETKLEAIRSSGYVGCVVPSGIATDFHTRLYFQHVVEERRLVSLYDFENKRGLFPEVHKSFRFCLLTLTGESRENGEFELAFFLHSAGELGDEARRFDLTPDDLELLNPNTRTCPIFRSRRDAELTRQIHRRVPVLLVEGPPEINPWQIRSARLFNTSNDSGLLRRQADLEDAGFALAGNRFTKGSEHYVPLYEAKMVNIYDHRAAHVVMSDTAAIRQAQTDLLSEQDHEDPTLLAVPRFWVPKGELHSRLTGTGPPMLLGICDITAATNARTMLAAFLPVVGTSDTLPLLFAEGSSARQSCLLLANLNSFVFDYCLRQSVGGLHISNYILNQLPVLPPDGYGSAMPWAEDPIRWVSERVLELTYSAWDMAPFAAACGYEGAPFRWNEERRFLLRAELDAAYFRAYGLGREDVAYVLETFPTVRKREERSFGSYRSRDAILRIYDRLGEASSGTVSSQSELDPAPADPDLSHTQRPSDELAAVLNLEPEQVG